MKNKQLFLIFSISLIVRLLYCFSTPFFNVKLDEQRYDILSNQILNGNFNLDAISFICAPLLPFFLAIIKLISINYWQEIMFVFQSFLTALSVVFLYKLTDLLFKNRQISTIAAWFYCFYPMGFYYVKNIGQESFYQSFLIISIYFLIKFSEINHKKDLIISAILFSFCFLTKGIILIYAPFIVFFIFKIKQLNLKEKFSNTLIFSCLCLILTMPFGFYNLQKNKVYTFSGDGLNTYFWFGNSAFGYQRDILGSLNFANNKTINSTINDTIKSVEIIDTAKLIYDMSPPNVSLDTYKKAFDLFPSEQERQAIFNRSAFTWIAQHPNQFFELKLHCFIRFFLCGLNYKIYPLSIWLLSVVIFLPLYFLAYQGIFIAVKTDFSKHNWIAGLMLTLLLFSIVFSFESRFRTITLEPFYIIYAAFSAYRILIKHIAR